MAHHVLHLLSTAKREGTSFVRMVAGLAASLDSNRYRIHAWFLLEDGPLSAELEARGARVRFVPWRGGKWDPAGAYRFWRALHAEKFALIHEHFGGRLSRLLSHARGEAKIILHFHASTIESSGRRMPLPSFAADEVIAVSRSVASDVVGKRAHIVYPGIPIEEVARAEAPADTSAGEHRIVGTACRLVPVKGLDNLIRAIAVLREEFPALRLEIAGEGPEQGRLQALVRACNLTDRVTFLGWQDPLGPVMAHWAVFALPSLDEGFGIAVLEAMRACLPVVATRCGGLPEVVEDGSTGRLVPPNDPRALAEGLRVLLLDPDRRRAMGLAGRARLQEHFSLRRMAAEIARIYEGVLKQP